MPQLMGANAVGWIMTVIVLLLLFVNGAILKKPFVLLLTGDRANGRVVGWKQDGDVKAPIVEFTARAGVRVRVTGRVSTATPSVHEGDAVAVAYRASDPEYAQLFLWREFMASAAFLGIAGLLVVFWMAAILVAGDPGFGDPLHLLSRLTATLRLNPVRFPQLFVLSLAIPACAVGAASLFRSAAELRRTGIRVTGHVTDFRAGFSRLQDGRKVRGMFPMVTYVDVSGATHTIRRSAAWPLTRLKTDDAVEVIYLARKPAEGVVNSWDELYLVPVFFSLMMVAFLGVFVAVRRGLYG